jgi:hypothetical protein
MPHLLWVGVVLQLAQATAGKPIALHDTPQQQGIGLELFPGEAAYDFGEIPPWASVSHTFALHNNGAVPVTIDDVIPSCSCTTAKIAARSVAPGETVPVNVTFDPSDLAGVVERTVTVNTGNDTRSILRLRAKVSEPFHCSARTITFDHAERIAQSRDIVIEPAVQVTGIETESPVSADAVNDGLVTRLVIRLHSERLPETRSGVALVRVSTTQSSTPVPVRVVWEKTPVFRVAPRQLVLDGNDRSREVTVESLDGTNFRITRVTTTDNRLSVRSLRRKPGKSTITIHLRGNRGIRISDTLVISTDRVEEPELRVPLLALIP